VLLCNPVEKRIHASLRYYRKLSHGGLFTFWGFYSWWSWQHALKLSCRREVYVIASSGM
jgi:hypothetical protein